MKSSNRSLSRWFKTKPSTYLALKQAGLQVEQLEERNMLSASPIAFKNGLVYGSVTVGDTFYFSTEGGELWKSDGTPGGSALVKDLTPAASNNGGPVEMIGVGNTLYFLFIDPATNQEALWKSDGTEAGTAVVKDFGLPLPIQLTDFNGSLYFLGQDPTDGFEALWKSDGTEQGTTVVKDFPSVGFGMLIPYGFEPFFDSRSMLVANSSLYFQTGVSDIWKSDGTSEGTTLLAPSDPINLQLYYEAELMHQRNLIVDGIQYFTSYNSDQDRYQLWQTDGSDGGTSLVDTGNLSVDPSIPLRALNNELIVMGYSSSQGHLIANIWSVEKGDTTPADPIDLSTLDPKPVEDSDSPRVYPAIVSSPPSGVLKAPHLQSGSSTTELSPVKRIAQTNPPLAAQVTPIKKIAAPVDRVSDLVASPPASQFSDASVQTSLVLTNETGSTNEAKGNGTRAEAPSDQKSEKLEARRIGDEVVAPVGKQGGPITNQAPVVVGIDGGDADADLEALFISDQSDRERGSE
jgi:ELWxxDGT repeat protein